MTSQIDPTLPIVGTPTTASVRANFQTAHDEITALQNAASAITATQVAISPAIGSLGPHVQAGLTYLNTNMATSGYVAATYLPFGGGTMSGPIHSVPGDTIDGPVGVNRGLFGRTGTANRWQLCLGEGTAEGGSNAGSHFQIARYNDSGALIDVPLIINRQYANITIQTNPQAGLPITITGPTASYRGMMGATNGSPRWALIFGDTTNETGTNTGSNFGINRYNDAGNPIDAPIVISRASGLVSIPNMSATALAAGSIVCGHGAALGAITNVPGFCVDPSGGAVFENSPNAAAYFNHTAGAGTVVNYLCAGGYVGSISVTTTSTAYNTTSDERLKEDAQPFDAGPILDALRVYDFAWIATSKRAHGVIAQEAVETYPDAVIYDEANDWWGVDYSKFVPLLLNEVKALRARVAALEAGA
jgi:hypothetical protein